MHFWHNEGQKRERYIHIGPRELQMQFCKYYFPLRLSANKLYIFDVEKYIGFKYPKLSKEFRIFGRRKLSRSLI